MAEVRSVAPASSIAANSLLSGTAWQGRVTFGFAREAPADTAILTFGATSAQSQLKSAVRDAFAQVEAFTKLAVRESGGGTDADLRVLAAEALTLAQPGGPVSIPLGGYAFSPGAGELAGDIFLGRTVTGDLAKGSYGYRAVLHEVGHALGLKHPHEAGPYGALPAALDSPEASVMCARSAPGMDVADGLGTERGGFAETYMPADIAALQHLYGANFGKAQDTRYVFDPDERVMLQTIWDGGGTDTYDFRHYRDDVSVDLAPGGHSTTGQEPQLNRMQEISRGAPPVYAEGAIHNAFLFEGDKRSLIENAVGGGGDDTLRGNVGDNRLSGGNGDDRLFGEANDDSLFGGRGDDQLAGGRGDDVLDGGSGGDVLRGDGGGDTIRGGIGDDRAYGGGGHDRLLASHGEDRLWGGGGRDMLDGGQGDDWLKGGAQDDRLFGGLGSDVLIGGAGDDTLSGGRCGRQEDRLTGGGGADVFIVTSDAVVVDFDAREGDVLDVVDPIAAFRSLGQAGADALVDLGDGDSILLLDVRAASLDMHDFI